MAGFTLVEVIIAIALVGLGITSTVAVLTKLNAFASANRNETGAYAAAMNQIDLIQSAGPFNPQHKESDGTPTPQIPPVLTVGTTTNTISIYGETPGKTVVPGTIETKINDASGGGLTMYRASVKVTWQYLGRPYQLDMNTVRASDE